jgi:hypothetical protein
MRLGNTPFTVGRYGCLITDLSMISDYFHDYKSPKYFAKYGRFQPDGQFIWTSLPEISKLVLVDRSNGRNDEMIMKGLKDPKLTAILQVNKNHFVLALGKSLLGGYNIADPWTGKKSTTRYYGNNITGARIISTH